MWYIRLKNTHLHILRKLICAEQIFRSRTQKLPKYKKFLIIHDYIPAIFYSKF